MAEHSIPSPVLILAGGIALGAYQAGAFACLAQRGIQPVWITGSSIGAVNAAVIAGSPAGDRVAHLEALWLHASSAPFTDAALMPGPMQHAANWATAIGTRLMGAVGQFHPRMPNPFAPFRSFYDLEPLRERVTALVDFDRLNGDDIRLTVAATDLETGELVLFDTARGDRIGIDHLLASCGFLPEFAPVELNGRLLGDGGLSANAPIEALHHDPPKGPLTVFVLDLFPRDGKRPASLEEAILRKNDLTFANQTWQRLDAYCRELELRERLAALRGESGHKGRQKVFYLSYRPDPSDAISDKMYDYSPRTIDGRWKAGARDMDEALRACGRVEEAQARPFAIRRPSKVPA
jgi:NTE family protein